MIKIPSKVKYLSYSGIIPIIIGLIGSFDLNFISNNLNDLLIEFGVLFSATILSFLGGGLLFLRPIINLRLILKDYLFRCVRQFGQFYHYYFQ